MKNNIQNRTFLFLQGPHGPFFHTLGKRLRNSGHGVYRVGFNISDRLFWPDKQTYIPYKDTIEMWEDTLQDIIKTHNITDICFYGDVRPIHAKAVEVAKKHNITLHVFEEGYMRPYWVTYERTRSNGYSRLVDISVKDMQKTLKGKVTAQTKSPSHWGNLYHHAFYGALYHFCLILFNKYLYPNFTPHREHPIMRELMLYLKRIFATPLHNIKRDIKTHRITRFGAPYHIVLLQLEHDANFQAHSPFDTIQDFMRQVVVNFAKGAPKHHHLVFKAHPMDANHIPYNRILAKWSAELGIKGRVHFVHGGKLARILIYAQTAITVNSTAAQQALWRGMPLKSFGKAVYSKPEFVDDKPLEQFFGAPNSPDLQAYYDYRSYLLKTSQVPGGYYSSFGRKRIMYKIIDMMLDKHDPYDALEHSGQ